MKLNIKPDCRNSPKKELIKNLTIYFASYDMDNAMNHLADSVEWTLVGEKPVFGKEQFKVALEQMSQNKDLEWTIHSIITHGIEAAVNGEILMESGDLFGFSDFYKFSSSKGTNVKSIISYVVKKN